MRKITPDDALEYYRLGGKPGKLAIVPTKPMATQHDLALDYSASSTRWTNVGSTSTGPAAAAPI